jgi:hypothetical protein
MNVALKHPTSLMFYSHCTCYFHYRASHSLLCVLKCLTMTWNTCHAQKCHGVHMLNIVMLLLETSYTFLRQVLDDSTNSLQNDERKGLEDVL